MFYMFYVPEFDSRVFLSIFEMLPKWICFSINAFSLCQPNPFSLKHFLLLLAFLLIFEIPTHLWAQLNENSIEKHLKLIDRSNAHRQFGISDGRVGMVFKRKRPH